MITVILSAYNECLNPFFWKTLDTIKNLQDGGFHIKVLVGVTKGSDDTLLILEGQNIKFIEVDTSKRAERYNYAFEHVNCGKQDWIILNHPRSLLETNAFMSLNSLPVWAKWGAFSHKFDINHPLLNFTSWWSNHVRGDLKRIYYLDHCLFVRREAFERVGGFPSLDIFEDTVLSQRLGALGSPIRLPWRSTTSSIRFKANGIWRQALKNQVLKCRYTMGHDVQKMNADYESGVALNCLYESNQKVKSD